MPLPLATSDAAPLPPRVGAFVVVWPRQPPLPFWLRFVACAFRHAATVLVYLTQPFPSSGHQRQPLSVPPPHLLLISSWQRQQLAFSIGLSSSVQALFV